MRKVTDVKCGKCKVPLKGPVEPKAEDTIICPECGSSDTYENVLREVRDYAEEQAAKHLEKALASGVKGSEVLKFTPAVRSKRTYRFIADLDLH
jgi:uncharacterized Zn finger protein (UPF0148 family)